MDNHIPSYTQQTPRRTEVGFLSSVLSTYHRSSTEQKILFFGALTTIIGCFLPWAHFSGVGNVGVIRYNAFQNITFLFGYSIFFLSGTTLLGLLSESLQLKFLDRFKEHEHLFHKFASFQILFLSFLAYSIYSSFYQIRYSSTSYVQIGIYLTFIGGVMLAVGTYYESLRLKRVSSKRTVLPLEQEEDTEELLRLHNEDRGIAPLTNDVMDYGDGFQYVDAEPVEDIHTVQMKF